MLCLQGPCNCGRKTWASCTLWRGTSPNIAQQAGFLLGNEVVSQETPSSHFQTKKATLEGWRHWANSQEGREGYPLPAPQAAPKEQVDHGL